MNLHEIIRRRVFGRHIGMADPGKSPVRRLDLLDGGAGRYAEDLVERSAGGVQIRRPRLLRPGRASVGGGGSGGEGDYWPGSDVARRRSHGVPGEVGIGERRRKRYGGEHVCVVIVVRSLRFGNGIEMQLGLGLLYKGGGKREKRGCVWSPHWEIGSNRGFVVFVFFVKHGRAYPMGVSWGRADSGRIWLY